MKVSRIYLYLLILSLVFTHNTNHQNENISLGRDSDPRTVDDISFVKLLYKKAFWSTLSILGPRNISKIAYPNSISYFDSNNSVAFTIDDGFCGLDNPKGDMTEDVRLLLDKYNANATFFVSGTHCAHTRVDVIKKLLNDGHELANHNLYDISYSSHTSEDFENDLLMTKEILDQYTPNLSKWYRAPHASINDSMHEIIKKHNLVHVIGDSFANDTSIPDAKWIAQFILKRVQPGSIIIIHMPEKGVREWNYEAMELILMGLKEKNLNILNLTELDNLN